MELCVINIIIGGGGNTDFLHTIDLCGPLMHLYSQLVS